METKMNMQPAQTFAHTNVRVPYLCKRAGVAVKKNEDQCRLMHPSFDAH